MGSDLPGEGIEGGREVGGKRGEGGEGKERYVFYWVFGGEAEGGSEQQGESAVVVVVDSAGSLPSRVYRGAAGAAAQLIRGFAHVHTHTLLRLRGW